jgi:glycosyltransferase involved in cell wall biosynthesis
MNTTKICYVIRQLEKGGAEKQLFYLVRGLNKDRFHPIIVCLTPGGYWKKRIKDLNVEIFEIKKGHLSLFKQLVNLVKFLRKVKPDIVHTFMITANSYGRLGALLAGVPLIIVSERNIYNIGNDKKRWQVALDKILFPFTKILICNTNTARLNLTKKYGYQLEKILTIYNGIDITDFKRRLVSKKPSIKKFSRQVVGTVGTLKYQKNHRLFLDMARITLDHYQADNLSFIVVGDGALMGELQNYAVKRKIESKVRFLGQKNDIPMILNNMTVFANSSHYEGLCNATMEAMASGLPVVATDVGGNRELVVDGQTGFLTPPGDASALAEKVMSLLGNDALARKMGARGLEKISKSFTVERMVEQTEAVYYRLLNRKVMQNGI